MTKMQRAMYRAMMAKREKLIGKRKIAITGHEKSSHILAQIQECTHAMMWLEVGK